MVVVANALDCASIHGITVPVQLPMAARIASLKTHPAESKNCNGWYPFHHCVVAAI
jgi:hypothetical protein